MNYKVMGIGIILIVLSIFFVYMANSLAEQYKPTGETKEVPCYDKEGNLILGISCTEIQYTGKEALWVAKLMIQTTFMLIFVGIMILIMSFYIENK